MNKMVNERIEKLMKEKEEIITKIIRYNKEIQDNTPVSTNYDLQLYYNKDIWMVLNRDANTCERELLFTDNDLVFEFNSDNTGDRAYWGNKIEEYIRNLNLDRSNLNAM